MLVTPGVLLACRVLFRLWGTFAGHATQVRRTEGKHWRQVAAKKGLAIQIMDRQPPNPRLRVTSPGL
jgi:hypothetical protein